jgi:hypothetical protein
MCFSAQASFTAATFCGTVGIATIRRSSKKYLLIAAIPFIFGIHQFIEGVEWLLKDTDYGVTIGFIYASIAFCLWPVYIPIACWVADPSCMRPQLRSFLIGTGITVSLYGFYVLSFPLKIDASFHQISYVPGIDRIKWIAYPYAVAVIIPLFFMRIVMIKIFGALVLLFFILAYKIFNPAHESVWCFFAASSSVLLFFAVESKANLRGINGRLGHTSA